MKIIYRKENALEKIASGVKQAGDIVRSTYGPTGENVLIKKKYSKPRDTNDGYSVIKEIELEDETEDLAVRILEEGAHRTNEEAGDATTTTVMLSQDIFFEAYSRLKETGGIVKKNLNSNEIKKEILEASQSAIKELAGKGKAQQIESYEQLKNIAFIASQDKDMADIVSKVAWEVGKDGLIKTDDSDSPGITSSVSLGMEVKSGYMARFMATNDKRESIISNPYILVCDFSIKNINQIAHLINMLSEKEIKELVIFATDFDNAVLEAFKYDRIQGHFSVLAIKANIWDKGILEDICTVTGARLGEIEFTSLGRAAQVVSDQLKTIIIGGVEDKSEALQLLQIELDITKEPFEKQKIKERIARISGKIGVITVGAVTEIEQGRLKDKVDDTIHAALGALQEGYVSGGGAALFAIGEMLLEGNILKKALMAPHIEIGVPINTTEIIDSVKSLRVAIESACITVCSLLAGTTIVEKNESDPEQDN